MRSSADPVHLVGFAIDCTAELGWLAKLDELRVLWLSHNPVAELPNYRATVLRVLPNLVKLDDKDVTPEEVEAAQTEGAEVQPLELDEEEEELAPNAGEGASVVGADDGTDDAGAYALSAIKVLLPLLGSEQLADLRATIAE